MNDHRLATLLDEADRRAGGPPPIVVGLAGRVRRRRRRERVARIGAVSGLAAVLLITSVVWTLWPAVSVRREIAVVQREPAVSAVDVDEIAQLRAEVASLRAQAEASTLAVELMQRMNRLAAWESAVRLTQRSLDPAIRAECEMEQAAITIVRQADRMIGEHGLIDAAAEAYTRVVRLFPETRAAADAAAKLNELKRHKGDLL